MDISNRKFVVIRHAERIKNTGDISGDGPLTNEGITHAEEQAKQLAAQLREQGIRQIDQAIISGSIRCAQTWAIYWSVLLASGIKVVQFIMDRKFFSTPEEDEDWRRLYTEQLQDYLAAQREKGEAAATMEFAGDLVRACAIRTIAATEIAFTDGAQTVVSVTHGPHDILIAERFGADGIEGLKLGEFRLIENVAIE